MPAYLFILVMLAIVWFFLIRPRQRQMRSQQQQVSSLQVGDEIVTAGGLYGEITKIGEGDVTVRIAPELEVRVARRAVAGVTPPELEEPADDDEADRSEPTPGT